MNIADENNLLNILNRSLVTRNWYDIYDNFYPKTFGTNEPRKSFKVLAKIAETVVNEEYDIPDKLKIMLLKYLGNSCLTDMFTHKDYEPDNAEYGKYCKKLYADLAEDESKLPCEQQEKNICFPYNGIAEWTIDYIISNGNVTLSEEQVVVLRLCIQFLCNLFTFACNNINLLECKRMKNYLTGTTIQNAIVKFICYEDISVTKAACIFIHNALKKFGQDYFTQNDKIYVCSQLLKKTEDLFCAKNTLLRLLNQESVFISVYEDISMEDKLLLLELIHEEAQNVIYVHDKSDTGFTFSQKLINFLSNHFCQKSDLILKTKDTYLNDFEPMEVIILLDILGVLTSEARDELYIIQNNISLLINCCYLLKSLHMCGKESENYFTPVQRLRDTASGTQRKNDDIEFHPAFGFKVDLIRVIGNMSYKNKKCQDIIRETDTIPLIFDCCNIDARNPFIMQWTILAIRNLCEANVENQEIIRNFTKIGVIDNTILEEMGLTLQEDENGKFIGIVPL